MNDSSDTLRINDLTKIFRIKTGNFRHTELRAVDEVSLSITPGRTLAVVGESGSGKTTLARLILRLIEPTQGSVHLAWIHRWFAAVWGVNAVKCLSDLGK